jgi:hypothetical protein
MRQLLRHPSDACSLPNSATGVHISKGPLTTVLCSRTTKETFYQWLNFFEGKPGKELKLEKSKNKKREREC